jgi:hypothetical protein
VATQLREHDIVSQPARERPVPKASIIAEMGKSRAKGSCQGWQLLRTINDAAKIRFDVRNTRLQRLSAVEQLVWITCSWT